MSIDLSKAEIQRLWAVIMTELSLNEDAIDKAIATKLTKAMKESKGE